MRESDLSSPDAGAAGFHLRRVMAKVVSYLEVNAYANGKHPSGVPLAAFLTEALAAVNALKAIAAVQTFTPTEKTYSIAAGVTVGPVLAKGGSEGAVTYSSANPAKCTVNAATGAITPVATGTSVITATTAASGGYLATTHTYIATVTA